MARSWWIRGVGLTGIGALTLARALSGEEGVGMLVLAALFMGGGLASMLVAQRRSKPPP